VDDFGVCSSKPVIEGDEAVRVNGELKTGCGSRYGVTAGAHEAPRRCWVPPCHLATPSPWSLALIGHHVEKRFGNG